MKYTVRLNPKAYNALTGRVDPRRVWEVEQNPDKDSGRVIWHCENVTVRDRDGVVKTIERLISEKYGGIKKSEPTANPVTFDFSGIVVRAADESIMIIEGRTDVS